MSTSESKKNSIDAEDDAVKSAVNRRRSVSITIRATENEKAIITRCAQKRGRSISAYLIESAIHKQIFKGAYSREYDDYICVDELGRLYKPSYVTNHFSVLLKQLGMKVIRFHDLRHTFASILINSNKPLIEVSGFLGHSDISTTANIYAHLDKSSKQGCADAITEIFEGKESKKGTR